MPFHQVRFPESVLHWLTFCANPRSAATPLLVQGGRKRVQSAHARLTSSPEAIAADMAALDHFDQKVGSIAPKPKHQKTRVPRTTR